MIDDGLRLVGSAQTNRDMEAELTRIAGRALGVRPPQPSREGTGQLVYPWDDELARVAQRYHRTSTRVVRDLYTSSARRLEPLYDELRVDAESDLRGWDQRVRTISVEVRRVAEFAAGERQIVGTVKNAILDGCASRGRRLAIDAERPDALVVARLDDRGRLRVGLDLNGGTRTRRGWRTQAGDAPLREHIAAVIAMEARYDPRRDLVVDPMCGSGTLAIEAALLARGAPVDAVAGLSGGCSDAPDLWPDARPVVIAGDHDLGVLAGARDNARRAGADIVFHRGDFAALERDRLWAMAADAGAVPERGLVLCNPPWGQRLEVADARLLYGALGDWWRSLGTFRAAFLVANAEFEPAFGSEWSMKKPLSSGDLRGYLYVYQPPNTVGGSSVSGDGM
jgi:23S rRNA G2445 N2-methylase RlmL